MSSSITNINHMTLHSIFFIVAVLTSLIFHKGKKDQGIFHFRTSLPYFITRPLCRREASQAICYLQVTWQSTFGLEKRRPPSPVYIRTQVPLRVVYDVQNY
jgi:hypothetical protein